MPGMTLDEIKKFRQLDSKTPGHPENFMTTGVETTTGPLGQGLATAVGMALAERMLAAEFGKKVVDHHTYVLASDGDLMEGIRQEAIALAGHQKLNKLIVLWDDNGISIDGPLSISDSVDQVARFKACGWRAERVDGHDPDAIEAAIARAQKSNKPTMIACKTVIGFGAPKKAGTSKAHGEPLGAEELQARKDKLGIPATFEMPPTCSTPGGIGLARPAARTGLACRFGDHVSPASAPSSSAGCAARPAKLAKAHRRPQEGSRASPVSRDPQGLRARARSDRAVMPELAGSADLTGSNNTKAKGLAPSRPRLRRAATSITASASTAWLPR